MATPSFPQSGGKKKLSTRNKWVIGGVAVVGTIGAVWYYKKQSASSTAANSTDSGIDPNTGIPYADETSGADSGIDPNTGVPYADEYGGFNNAGIGSVPGLLGTYDPLTGTYVPGSGTATTTPTTPGTNAEWAAAAEATLVADGYNPVNVAAAIGAYLSGAALSANEYSIVQSALAFEGQPPVSVPPPHQTGTGGNNNNTGGANIPVPNVIGKRAAVAFSAVAAKGLIPSLSQGTPKGWTGTITAESPAAGTKVKVGSRVKLTNTVKGPANKGGPVHRPTPPKKKG